METQVAPIDEHVIIESRLISLNSKFATEYLNGTSKSSVSFDFNAIARKDSRVLYHTIAIQSAEIPSSFYNINASNNITNITRAGSAAFNITMPVGNYDSATYLATFKTLYEAANANVTLNITFSAITGKYSLQEAGTAQQQVTFNAAASNSFAIWGGLDADIVFPDITAQPVASSFPALANFLGITKIKVASNALAGDNYDSVSLNTSTLIDTISVTAGPFGLTVYNSLGRESFVKAKRIDEIDIQLYDQDDNTIDFNNTDWNFTIILNSHRKQLFSTQDGIINFQKLTRFAEASVKPEPLKKELEELPVDEEVKEIFREPDPVEEDFDDDILLD